MGKITGAGKRLLTGESIFLTHFTNTGSGKSSVGFSAPFPGQIIPINLAECGGKLICQKDSFLCAAMGTKISMELTKKFGAGLVGGEGFVLQKLLGDGMAFIHAGGTVIPVDLEDTSLRVDTGCLVGFTRGIEYSVQRAGNLKSMFLGGEGIFLAELKGTGRVYLQTLPFSRMCNRIADEIDTD